MPKKTSKTSKKTKTDEITTASTAVVTLNGHRFMKGGKVFVPIMDSIWNAPWAIGANQASCTLYAKTRAQQGFTGILVGIKANIFNGHVSKPNATMLTQTTRVMDSIAAQGLMIMPIIEMTNYKDWARIYPNTANSGL